MKRNFKRTYALYKAYVTTALFVMAILSMFLFKEQSTVSYTLLGVGLFLTFINSIPEVTYTKAARIAQEKTPNAMNDALALYEKAYAWGLKPQQEIVVGTLQLQYGDKERGKTILEYYLEDENNRIVDAVKVSLSMYYWMNKDTEKAIALCEEAYKDGMKEANLYINLCTYYLEADRIKDYKEMYKEAFDNKMGNIVMKDLEASLALKEGKWQRAGNCLNDIFEQVNPAFEDPYVHFAIVNLHYGNWEGAVEYLKKIDTTCQYNNTSIYTEEEIHTLINALEEEETRWSILEAADKDPNIFIKGIMPEIKKGIQKPECPELPTFMEESVQTAAASQEKKDANADDEREVSTDLTDEDEEWLRKHS